MRNRKLNSNHGNGVESVRHVQRLPTNILIDFVVICDLNFLSKNTVPTSFIPVTTGFLVYFIK